MKYPSVYLVGRKARGEVLSIALAGREHHQDAGAKMYHLAPDTTSRILSKSISRDGGRTSYRGTVHIGAGATNASASVTCDAMLLDERSRSDTYPSMQGNEATAQIEHEATVEKIGTEKLLYLMSRGLKQSEAESLIVNGFLEPVVKEIPFEYSIELHRLINFEMSKNIG